MIWTVFPKNEDDGLPQDFSTRKKAKDWAEENIDGEYEIEPTDGDIV